MEDNSNRQLPGCSQAEVSMLVLLLGTALKTPLEVQVASLMVWLRRVEIYLGLQLEEQVLVFSQAALSLELVQDQLNNQVSSNLVQCLNLAALEEVQILFLEQELVQLQMILMRTSL